MQKRVGLYLRTFFRVHRKPLRPPRRMRTQLSVDDPILERKQFAGCPFVPLSGNTGKFRLWAVRRLYIGRGSSGSVRWTELVVYLLPGKNRPRRPRK